MLASMASTLIQVRQVHPSSQIPYISALIAPAGEVKFHIQLYQRFLRERQLFADRSIILGFQQVGSAV